MHSNYCPDSWVVLKIDDFYKVLAGWSGGYLSGDSWRINSGITECLDRGDSWEFKGASGSSYICHKKMYGLRRSTDYVHYSLVEKYGDCITLMDEDTDWLGLDYK